MTAQKKKTNQMKIIVKAPKEELPDYLATVAEEVGSGRLTGKEGRDHIWWSVPLDERGM